MRQPQIEFRRRQLNGTAGAGKDAVAPGGPGRLARRCGLGGVGQLEAVALAP